MKFRLQVCIAWSYGCLILANAFDWTKVPGDTCGVTGKNVLLLWEYNLDDGDDPLTLTAWFREGVLDGYTIASYNHNTTEFKPFVNYIGKVEHNSSQIGGLILKNVSPDDGGKYVIELQPGNQQNATMLVVYEGSDLDSISFNNLPTTPVSVKQSVPFRVNVSDRAPVPLNITVTQTAVPGTCTTANPGITEVCNATRECSVALITDNEGRFDITADVVYDCYDHDGSQTSGTVTVGMPREDPCLSNPCPHEYTCLPTDDCSNYTCNCTRNSAGGECNNNTPVCDSEPCENHPCSSQCSCRPHNCSSCICDCVGCGNTESEMALIIGVAVAGGVVVVIGIIVLVVLHRQGRLRKKQKPSGMKDRIVENGGGKTYNDIDNSMNNAAYQAPQNVDPEGNTDPNPPESNEEEPPEDVPAVPKKNFGPDVILYADLEFNKDATAAPPVVHRKVEPTEYADINFARSAKTGKK